MKKIVKLLKKIFSILKKTNTPQTMKERLLNAGSFFRMSAIQGHVKNLIAHVKTNKASSEVFIEDDGDIRRAELFGKNIINKLLADKGGREVVGIRIYYGHAFEDADGNIVKAGGKLRPRLFLVPVDENGKDIEFDSSALKDDPNGDGAGGGLPCPKTCA